MRRTLVLVAMGAVAFGGVSAARSADDLQTLEARVLPTKLDKRKYEPGSLFVDVFTGLNDESAEKGEQPPSVSRIRVDLPKNVKFDGSALPRCNVGPGELEGKTAAQQAALCGAASKVSVDSGSSAQVTFDATPLFPTGDSNVSSVAVQAFNGRESDTLYLATDPEGFVTTPVIVGKLNLSDAGKPFGRQLDLSVPALDLGAFSDIKLTIAAKDYLQTRCRATRNRFQLRSDYSDHSPTTTTVESVCKQQKKKKKKKG